MSNWRPDEVWTEHEKGDFEACVATSYAMGLLYGGVPMAAPYTQAERERLEVSFNEPQDLTTTDAQALTIYGAKLRPPAPGIGKTAFLARPGVGYCLTGTGSPLGLQQPPDFMHEVFAVAQSDGVVRVYDPLAAAGSQPTDMPVADMAKWMKGVTSDDVREIRKDELSEVELKGTPIEPVNNRVTTITHTTGLGLAKDPTAQPFANITVLPVGTKFTVDWRVRANTLLGSDEWYGGWVLTSPPQFGYLPAAGCGPLTPIETGVPG